MIDWNDYGRIKNLVGQYQNLSAAEEARLIPLANTGDGDALDRIVRANLKVAFLLSKRFAEKSSCNLYDLFQEAVASMTKAVKTFNLSDNNRFSAYARTVVERDLIRITYSESFPVTIPHRTSLVNATRAYHSACQSTGSDGIKPSLERIAKDHGVDPRTLASAIDLASVQPIGIDGIQEFVSSDDAGADDVIVSAELELFFWQSVETALSTSTAADRAAFVNMFAPTEKDITQAERASGLGMGETTMARKAKGVCARIAKNFKLSVGAKDLDGDFLRPEFLASSVERIQNLHTQLSLVEDRSTVPARISQQRHASF